MPAWRTDQPPADTRHLYHQRPEWFWYDQHSRRQPLGWYVSLNPCLPAVRGYLVEVCEEIVTKYPVDGLHLDYIRFPTDRNAKGVDYSHDPATLRLYRKATGKRPQDSDSSWRQWRTQQVTQLVFDIRRMMRRKAKTVWLTAACGPNLEESLHHHFQDGPRWVRDGMIDMAFVMNYSRNTEAFRQRQEAWRRAAAGGPVAAGIGLYLHDSPRMTIDQLQWAGRWGDGFAVFSNNVLLTGTPKAQHNLDAIRPTLLSMRDRALVQHRKAPRIDAPPPGPANTSSNRSKPRNPYGLVP
jgi:uncharacterized lipoprotein YddW (UPF0748 family)